MTNSFEAGEKVHIKPLTFHNVTDEPKEAKFYSYMAGRKYAVLLIWDFDGPRNIRINVEDLEKV
jgi:uncharacterized protein (DUF2141 family)